MHTRTALWASLILTLTAGCSVDAATGESEAAETSATTKDDVAPPPASSAAEQTPTSATTTRQGLRAASAEAPDTGAVFTLSNDPTSNEVIAFARGVDGSLSSAGSFATGGKGTGKGLGSQGALALSPNGKLLVAVDAGSNEITSFTVDGAKLIVRSRVSSGGEMPVSVAVQNDLVYVVNAGGTNCISGFRLAADGTLTPLANSTHTLSAPTVGPAEVAFRPDGKALVVTEKMTNVIDTFAVGADGLVSDGYASASVGMTPFGFAFAPAGQLLVTEAFGAAAGASATSSYLLENTKDVTEPTLAPISRSVKTNQTAACWIAVTANGKWAFTANTPSNNISAYAVQNGELTLRGSGATAATGDGTKPTDLALDVSSKHLFALNNGTHEIAMWNVTVDGGLTATTSNVKVPDFAQGLAAR